MALAIYGVAVTDGVACVPDGVEGVDGVSVTGAAVGVEVDSSVAVSAGVAVATYGGLVTMLNNASRPCLSTI